MYRNEDDFWNDNYDAQDEAEREAQESAEMAADLVEFETEEARDAYIEEYFDCEYQRLCREYEKTL